MLTEMYRLRRPVAAWVFAIFATSMLVVDLELLGEDSLNWKDFDSLA